MEQIDELTMNSIGFSILCNFPQFCGVERAKEASEQFRAMKDELLAYRAAMSLEKAQALKEAEEQGRLVRLPCKMGDTVWYLNAQLQEICEAVIIKVELNYYTNPVFWVSILYQSKTIGAHEWKDRWDLMLGKTVFVNPPYGRSTIGRWVEKAYRESRKRDTTIVMLLPSRTDTIWFHDFILGKAEVRFVKGRLKFGGSNNSAPFPSMVVVYHRQEEL